MNLLPNVPIPSITKGAENVARLLQQALATAAQAADPANLTPTDLDLARSNVKAVAFVKGVGLHGAYRYLRDFIARQAIPIYSVGEFLDGWLATYKMPRKEPTAAQGAASGSGVEGAVLPQGTLLQANGRMFKVLADVSVVGGVVSPSLIALTVGAESNMAAGTTLTLVSSVADIDSSFTLASGGVAGGRGLESDEEAIYRLQQRLSNEPMGGAPGDYARWALAVPGITRAWGLRNPAGPTSAGVIIMADANAPYGLPTSGQRADVYAYITDPERGPPDELFVIIPAAQVVDLTVKLFPDTAAAREATTKALRDLFFRESVPGGKLPHNHLVEVISGVDGEYNHQVTSPALTVGGEFAASTFAHLLVLGAITFAS